MCRLVRNVINFVKSCRQMILNYFGLLVNSALNINIKLFMTCKKSQFVTLSASVSKVRHLLISPLTVL